jgi:hypothetical protein
MRAHVVFHAIAIVFLGLGLLSADCTGSGLAEDCEPGTLGCACGNFPECPKDEHNRVILCCPDPGLCCGSGNICKSAPASDCQDQGSDGGSGDGSTTTVGTTSTPDTTTLTNATTTGS